MAAMNSPRTRLRSERGAELIEFALVFPLLLLVVLGIVDFGFLFQRLEVVTNAAREGARMAVLAGYDDDDVKARVLDYVQTGGVPTTASPLNPVITVSPVDIPYDPADPAKILPGKNVTVVYRHEYLFLGGIGGWFGGAFSSLPLTGSATMRNESGSP